MSYNPTGFARIYNGWPESRQTIYENAIGRLLQGGPLTKEAHDQAFREATKGSPMRAGFAKMREAIEHGDTLL